MRLVHSGCVLGQAMYDLLLSIDDYIAQRHPRVIMLNVENLWVTCDSMRLCGSRGCA